MKGLNGNDAIRSLGGNDIVFGGDGNDIIDGGAGADRLNGDAGIDLLWGGGGADQQVGGAGDDLIDGGLQSDRLTGGAGGDVFIFGAGDTVSAPRPRAPSSRLLAPLEACFCRGTSAALIPDTTSSSITCRHSISSDLIDCDCRPSGCWPGGFLPAFIAHALISALNGAVSAVCASVSPGSTPVRKHRFQQRWCLTFTAQFRTRWKVTCRKRGSLVRFARGCWCSMP
ncbi:MULTISPECIES: calcium-binding protein [Synechococcales]|uniref:calcium-binding protein n=1 Tax=Synechococcus sp. CS-1333 TaxID=2848638 RepID=UPI0037DA4C03